MNLPIFAIADALNIRLGKDVTGKIRGHKHLDLKIGVWELPTDVLVEHDFQNTKSAAAWVKLRKHLWGYISNTDELRMTLFDASIVELRTADIRLFATGGLTTSLAKIERGAVQSFIFTSDRWVPCDFPRHLLKRGQKKNTDDTGSGAEGRPRTPA